MQIMHIVRIVIYAYCAYCAYSGYKKVIIRVFIIYCHNCLVPHPRAQLFTYRHLQPSPLFADLSQKAPGKSADSRRMAKGIIPVAPTGTRESLRKTSKYGEYWNHIQNLCWFTDSEFVDDRRLTLIQPG